MTQQKKVLDSQGAPLYSNTVKGDDPKYQVRVFNGKPQFRIRKRNESAKSNITRGSGIRKGQSSMKDMDRMNSGTIDDNDDENLVGYYQDEQFTNSRKNIKELHNQKVITQLQTKYGIGAPIPPVSKLNNRLPPNGFNMNQGLRKAYSNTNSQLQDSFSNLTSINDKNGKVPFKKKFTNMNKLPELSTNTSILPKIKS